MITDIEDYFTKGCGRCDRFATSDCSTRIWHKGLAQLREICRNAGLTETVKWGHPCYTAHGRNIAIIGAFRGDFRLSFFNAALLRDPEKLLEKQGAHTRHADMIRFSDPARVEALADIIAAYLIEARNYAEQGLKPPPDEADIAVPIELSDALDADPELAEAFYALTPGRQRSYVINLSRAKRPETRLTRISRFRDKIIAGKGAFDR